MPGTNLTRDEAFERSQKVTVDHYTVELDLTLEPSSHFGSVTTVHFDATPGTATFIDLVDAQVNSIELNGRYLPNSCHRDGRIQLDNLRATNVLRVDAHCPFSNSGAGLHRSIDPVDGRSYLYTQFEVAHARTVFAAFDQPDLKATFSFRVTAPDSWVVVSNSPTPTPTGARDGTAIWEFDPTPPLSTYVTAVIAGEYHSVHDTYVADNRTVPLSLYCRRSIAEKLDAEEVLGTTKTALRHFENLFTHSYPFEKFDQIFVPEFNTWGMENAGAVTLRDEMISAGHRSAADLESRANTIAHEIAHMWFGDLVTMRWWDDLWLNEAFAEFAATHCLVHSGDFPDAWTTFGTERKVWAYHQDQLPTTHPVVSDNGSIDATEANFDGITYAKGASALRQLVAWVGEAAFFTGLGNYFTKHAFGNTELTDLLVELESASGRPLQGWFREWISTTGVNTLRATVSSDESGRITEFAVEQLPATDSMTLRGHRIAVGFYERRSDEMQRVLRMEVDVKGRTTRVPELIAVQRPHAIVVNDDDLTYAKIRFDDTSLRTVLTDVHRFPNSLQRALVRSAAWDMARDGELSGSEYIGMVLTALETENDTTAIGALLRQGHTAVHILTEPSARHAQSMRWDLALERLLHASAPESDQRIQLVHALAESTTRTEVLEGLLGGAEIRPLHREVRWALVSGLARLGALGEREIAGELSGDDSVETRRFAAAALAIRPLKSAKRAALQAVTNDASISTATRSAIAAALRPVSQPDILDDYVDRFLGVAPEITARFGPAAARKTLPSLFPLAHPTSDTLHTVERWLSKHSASTDLTTARAIVEGAAELERALRAHARAAEVALRRSVH